MRQEEIDMIKGRRPYPSDCLTQKQRTGSRLASLEQEMDLVEKNSSEALSAAIYLAHARKEYAQGNYGVVELDLDQVAEFVRSVKD